MTDHHTPYPPSADGHAPRQGRSLSCLGPVADLEARLPEEWWRDMFDGLYLMTDGDVVENDDNTEREIDAVITAAGLATDESILDLCCGQGRHVLSLARRGYGHVQGIDRSRYLIRLARKRARLGKLACTFREGDARRPRLEDASLDAVLILGNSFGYFSSRDDDARVLRTVGRALRPSGRIVLDLTDGDWMRDRFEPRSWEWIDAHHFVCRERAMAGDGERLVSREVIVNDTNGVLADQFYAERLYTKDGILTLLRECGYREIRFHGQVEAASDRGQDLGMMARRWLITARAPIVVAATKKTAPKSTLRVSVLLGDPRLPDAVKRGGRFNAEDLDTVARLKDACASLSGYSFVYLDNHAALAGDLEAARPDLVFNLCDEGLQNDPFKELHVPALLESLGVPYTGAGPTSLGLCYDKALVRALAQAMDVPVPMEIYVRAGDNAAALPNTFPAILKPNFGDSSVGIDAQAVVETPVALMERLELLRNRFGDQPVLVQEYLTGTEYTVGVLGNPETGLEALPILEVDYSGLPEGLPRILGYESKWDPDSPYWRDLRYVEARLPLDQRRRLHDAAFKLFERLGCRDYARFDFRADAEGTIKLLEANPNPGWCWDGKMNLMAEMAGWSYAAFLGRILDAARERLRLGRAVQRRPAA